MANNDPNTADDTQANSSMKIPNIFSREANRVVSDRYSKHHAEARGLNGVEGQAHLSDGYRAARDQGYEVIEERNARLLKDNGVELGEEPRSVKRSRLKGLNGDDDKESPSEGRNVHARALSFGAALNKVPAPIWTQHKPAVPGIRAGTPNGVGDPKLPSIDQQLARLAAPDQPRANGDLGIDLQRGRSQSHDDIDPSVTDPYKDKADEIGLSHGFRGKDILEQYLTPLGWREGDPPINHTEARQLFDYSRNQLRKVYLRDIERTRNFSAPQQQGLNQQRDEAWADAYNFDKFILRKRKEIYDTYLQRQAENEYKQQVKDAHAALWPSLSARHVQADILRLPTGIPSFISPGVLDPRLVMNSFQAVQAQYAANKEKISRWNDANEYFVTSFRTVYGDVLRRGNLGQGESDGVGHDKYGIPSFEIPSPAGHGVPEQGTGRSVDRLDINGRPLASPLPVFPLPEHRDHRFPNDRQSLTVPRLHQSRTPSIADGQLEDPDLSALPRGQSSQITNEYPTPTMASSNGRFPESNLRHSIGAESRPTTPPPKKGRGAPASRKASTPGSKKETASRQRVLKPHPPKPQPWYQAEMEAANLPTNVPNKRTMEKLLKEAEADKKKAKENKSKNPTPSKRVRKRSPVDMKKGIVVSAAAARALHKAGVPWAPGSEGATVTGPTTTAAGGSHKGPIIIPDEATPNHRQTGSSTSQATTGDSRAIRISASPYVSTSNSTSELSSFEDPEDGTFVPGSKRRSVGLSSAKKRSKIDQKYQ